MRDKEKVRVYNQQYWVANRNKLLPGVRKRARAWEKKNSKRRNARDRARRALLPVDGSKQRRYRKRLRDAALNAYGRRCVCCGEDVAEFLTIDHINGGGNRQRKQLSGVLFLLWLERQGYPKGFRTLCFNCNWSAHVGNGKCYHERQREAASNKAVQG